MSEHWDRRAACKGADIFLFFPERGDVQQSHAEARVICDGCPVRTECLDDALGEGSQVGFRGGLSERERYAVKREREAAGL